MAICAASAGGLGRAPATGAPHRIRCDDARAIHPAAPAFSPPPRFTS